MEVEALERRLALPVSVREGLERTGAALNAIQIAELLLTRQPLVA